MKMVQCNKGHYYDPDRYPGGCPHCRAEAASLASDDKTVPQGAAASELTRTLPLGADEDKTTRVDLNPGSGEAFAVGWLICIKGIHFGLDFRLHSGRNFIGRGKDMDVCLEGDKSVSRSAQAIVVYDPKNKLYLAQPGESKELFYINGELVLQSRELKSHDRLEVGDEVLLFQPLCENGFDWDKAKAAQEDKA